MREVLLDGKQMTDRKTTHQYLKKQLLLPDYYGNNLDALWDLLSFETSQMTIYLKNISVMMDQLGWYGQSLLDVLSNVEEENDHIHIIWM